MVFLRWSGGAFVAVFFCGAFSTDQTMWNIAEPGFDPWTFGL